MTQINLLFTTVMTILLMNGLVLAQDTTMTITENGKVGIGTTAPRTQLHVFEGITTGGTLASPSAGAVTLLPPDGFAFFHIDNGPAGGRPTGRLRFSHGGAPGDFEIMTLTQAGRVGIGTDSPSHPLEMASGAHVTTGGVWTDASSIQYKENISNLTSEEAMSALENLNPVKFNYKLQKDEEYLGFIAEDVPDLVATKARKSLSPMDIVAVLTKVVQQQQKKIAELEARFNASQ